MTSLADQMADALGPDVEYFAIVARPPFALRYGPFDFAFAETVLDWGKREHVPVMITANCGANLTFDTIASLFGETREERAKLAAERRQTAIDLNTAMLELGDNVAHLLMRDQAHAGSRVERLRESFKPIERLHKELTKGDAADGR